MSPFADHLYRLRHRLKLSQRAMAELVGYEQGFISALELDKKSPTEEFIHKLINAFNLPSSEIDELRRAAEISQRKYCLPAEVPLETFHLVHRFWHALPELQPFQIRIIEELLSYQEQVGNLKYEERKDGRRKM